MKHVHFVGSSGFDSAAETFEQFGRHLSACASRFPDGETGRRTNWIVWQQHVLEDHPQFDQVDVRVDPRNPNVRLGLFGLKDGVDPAEVTFPALGYAEEAKASWAAFEEKVDAGVLPAGSRFQVAMPTPMAFNWVFLPRPEDHAKVEGAYERALIREVEDLAAALPAGRLAVQWDVATEMASLERGSFVDEATGHDASMDRTFDDMMARFSSGVIRLIDAVPKEMDAMVHLCYGDFGHKHSVEPSSLAHCVEMSNQLTAGAARLVDLIHMPVPRDRTDNAYFAPLADLDVPAATHISIGLVHHTDGADGARTRMALADKYFTDYGIATECGFGRRPRETLEELLKIHAEIAVA